ncbi:MAG: hypothetical protein AB7V27_14175 [Candidatus Binatia bacterium]
MVPVIACAVFLNTAGASGAAETEAVITGAAAPGARIVLLVQLNWFAVEALQSHPEAVAGSSKVIPVGIGSVTMIGSTVAAVPTLLTASVNIVAVLVAQ